MTGGGQTPEGFDVPRFRLMPAASVVAPGGSRVMACTVTAGTRRYRAQAPKWESAR